MLILILIPKKCTKPLLNVSEMARHHCVVWPGGIQCLLCCIFICSLVSDVQKPKISFPHEKEREGKS